MWRTLLIAGLLACLPTLALAQAPAWETCRGVLGPAGPMLFDCHPLAGPVDPQGRELWLRATIPTPAGDGPLALHLVGAASSEAWLNGGRLGANGRPAATARAEIPGRYVAVLPIRDSAWRADGNSLVVRLSAFHGGLRLDRPVGAIRVAAPTAFSRHGLLAVIFVAAGALFAAAFGFGVIHAVRRTGSSLTLAAMAAVAGLQAIIESLRPLIDYPYPLHAWRLVAIWVLAASFSILLVSAFAGRFWPAARRPILGLSILAVGATALASGFDQKTGWALFVGVVIAALAAAAGARQRLPGARLALAYLLLFLALAVAFPVWVVDLSFFLFAACLILPLLMIEVIRLGRDDRGREAALTQAASRPDRLTVASARGVELVPIPDILAVVGADDYVELRLAGGRRLLHAARLDRLEAQLPPNFLRIHRSAIANLAQARSLEGGKGRWRLCLSEGEPLPVSRARLSALREALDDR